MPLHSAMTGSELHQDRLISTATTGDAGKVTTPSAVTAGTGELRKLKVLELDPDTTTADAGKVWTPDDLTNDTIELRYLSPDDLDGYKVVCDVDFADISIVATEYAVLMHAAASVRIAVVLYAALTVADETVTVTIGTATGVPVVVPFTASAAGTIALSAVTTLSAAQAEGVLITVASAGTSTGPARAKVLIYTES